jgi:ribose transport system permease protein
LVGIINGQWGKLQASSFIATLGTMTIARGVAQIVNNNYNTDSSWIRRRDFGIFLLRKGLGGL